MPKILEAWEELFVPLAYRYRFYLSFRGREVFYCELENRRLEWRRSQVGGNAGGSSRPMVQPFKYTCTITGMGWVSTGCRVL